MADTSPLTTEEFHAILKPSFRAGYRAFVELLLETASRAARGAPPLVSKSRRCQSAQRQQAGAVFVCVYDRQVT